MASVEWVRPDSVETALAALADRATQAVAGGTTLLDLLKMGHRLPERFVDISRLPLDQIVETPASFTVGALVSNTALANHAAVRAAFPVISEAILSGASQQIRNAATVGGNIMQAVRCPYFRSTDWPCNLRAPGSGCEAFRVPLHSNAILGTSADCIAVHPSDMAVALLALDAIVHMRTADTTRTIPLSGFYLAPGREGKARTALPRDALVTAIEIPRPLSAIRSGYLKLRGRASYEFATASVAATLLYRNERVEAVSVGLGGVATRPWRRQDAERLLVGRKLDEGSIDRFCDALLDGADVRPETEHKVALARGAVHRMLRSLAAS